MKQVTENQIQQYAPQLLEGGGYQYREAPALGPDSPTPARQSHERPYPVNKDNKKNRGGIIK